MSSRPSIPWQNRELEQAWDEMEAALGGGAIVPQPEFTWTRTGKLRSGEPFFSHAILDVAGTTVHQLDALNFAAVCTRATVPFPYASDHSPIRL